MQAGRCGWRAAAAARPGRAEREQLHRPPRCRTASARRVVTCRARTLWRDRRCFLHLFPSLSWSVRGTEVGRDYLAAALDLRISGGEREDLVRPRRSARREHARLVDQVGDRHREHGVFARGVPVALKGDREREPVVGDLRRFASTSPRLIATTSRSERLRCRPSRSGARRRTARTSGREDQQHATSAKLVERELAAVDSRQGKRGRRRSGREPLAHQAAVGDRPDRGAGSSAGFVSVSASGREREHGAPPRWRAGPRSSPCVDQIGGRVARDVEELADLSRPGGGRCRRGRARRPTPGFFAAPVATTRPEPGGSPARPAGRRARGASPC